MQDDLTAILDKAFKAGEAIALRQVAQVRESSLAAGFIVGLITGMVGVVYAADLINWIAR